MNRKSLLLAVALTLAPLAWTQGTPAPATPPTQGTEHQHTMMGMQHQHMDAMKADMDKMKASLDQLKTNVGSISDPSEKARWQANVDMWTVMVGHMEQMMKHMDAMGPGKGMGPGMMHHGDMGTPPTPPPTQAKPQ